MRKIKLTFNSLYALSDTVGEFSNDMNSLEQVNRTLDDYSTFLEKSCLSKESLENDMISKEISIY